MPTPLEVVGLPDTSSELEVKVWWRGRAQELHPDLGGDPEIFQQTHEAYLKALDYVSTKACPVCGGKGYVDHVHGFFALKVLCPRGCRKK